MKQDEWKKRNKNLKTFSIFHRRAFWYMSILLVRWSHSSLTARHSMITVVITLQCLFFISHAYMLIWVPCSHNYFYDFVWNEGNTMFVIEICWRYLFFMIPLFRLQIVCSFRFIDRLFWVRIRTITRRSIRMRQSTRAKINLVAEQTHDLRHSSHNFVIFHTLV